MSRAAEAASRMTWPTTKQALRSRIASYRRILRQEFVAHGGFGDGYGKRFWLFTLYFLLRDDDEVRAYIDWYRSMFPDDHGEISQLLCWALMLHRFGREDEALFRFVQAIDDNLPAVADVVNDSQAPYGMWGEELLSLTKVDDAVVQAMTADERQWLAAAWYAPAVVDLRQRCVSIGRALVHANDRKTRVPLLDEQRALIRAFTPTHMPPLSTGKSVSWLMAQRASATSNSRKVINTTPDVWGRENQLAAIAKRGLHEIVVRFSDRQPLRLRGFDGEANAEQAAQMMMGKILSGISANISLRTAVGYIILPDGHGPEGVEEVDVTKM
jgi:hypothetical protein